MTIKLLGKYIFSRDGKCLFSLNEEEDDEKHKLIYGFLQTIISFIAHFNDTTDFITYSTESYQFSVLTLLTGYKIILITTNAGRTKEHNKKILKQFYRDIYVEFVVKNPVIKPGEEIHSKLSREQVIYYYASPSVGTSIQS